MRSKYRNRKTDGYDSAKEAARAQDLKLLEKAGEIRDLQEQVRINLIGPAGPLKHRSKRYPNGRKVVYVADFTYWEGDAFIIEDVKGFRTEVFKLKKAILESMGYKIRET